MALNRVIVSTRAGRNVDHGDKASLISFGQEAIGMTTESSSDSRSHA